jgi:hypothetical protein
MPEAFTVFLSAADKKRLVVALRRTDRDPGRALMRWTDRWNDEARMTNDESNANA